MKILKIYVKIIFQVLQLYRNIFEGWGCTINIENIYTHKFTYKGYSIISKGNIYTKVPGRIGWWGEQWFYYFSWQIFVLFFWIF
jgi:hypothetical protein